MKTRWKIFASLMVIMWFIFLCLMGISIKRLGEVEAMTKASLEVIDQMNQKVSEDFEEEIETGEITVESLGEYRATHYCTCTKCTNGSGVTASGTIPVQGRTCAMEGVPIGTKVLVAETGEILTVEDRFGDSSKTHCIDIYVEDHDEALRRGTFRSEIYILHF